MSYISGSAVRHHDHYDVLPTTAVVGGPTYVTGGTTYVSGGSAVRGATYGSSYVGAPATYVTGPTTTYVSGGSAVGGATYGTSYVGAPATYVGAPATTTYVTGGTALGGSRYIAAPATYSVAPTTTAYVSSAPVVGYPATSYGTTGYIGGATYATGGVYQTGVTNLHGSYRRPVTDDIPVESRIEYIPFETKHIEYDAV